MGSLWPVDQREHIQLSQRKKGAEIVHRNYPYLSVGQVGPLTLNSQFEWTSLKSSRAIGTTLLGWWLNAERRPTTEISMILPATQTIPLKKTPGTIKQRAEQGVGSFPLELCSTI